MGGIWEELSKMLPENTRLRLTLSSNFTFRALICHVGYPRTPPIDAYSLFKVQAV